MREADLPSEHHYESVNNFWKTFEDLTYRRQLEKVLGRDAWIAGTFWEHFDIKLDKLFHSPWAITLINVESWQVVDSVFQAKNNNDESPSDIYNRYGNELKAHSEKKLRLPVFMYF